MPTLFSLILGDLLGLFDLVRWPCGVDLNVGCWWHSTHCVSLPHLIGSSRVSDVLCGCPLECVFSSLWGSGGIEKNSWTATAYLWVFAHAILPHRNAFPCFSARQAYTTHSLRSVWCHCLHQVPCISSLWNESPLPVFIEYITGSLSFLKIVFPFFSSCL